MSPYRTGLPTHFVRSGRRGATWDLPRRFKGYKASGSHAMSMAGAATKCFLSIGDGLQDAYIAKFAHKNGEIETYTELFNNRLGMALGFNMAHSGIARLNGSLHFLSRSFRTDENEKLLHGSLLVELIGLADQTELDCINTASRQQGVYDIDFVKAVIYQVCDKYADNVFKSLIEMLIFDALTGAMDRHPKNWGVLATATKPVQYKFSPIYDSARALLWDYPDDKLKSLESNEGDFQRYVQRSHPRIGLPKSVGHIGKCSHVDLVAYLLREHREVTLCAYPKIRVDLVRIISHLLRQHPFPRVFTKRRSRMIVRLLKVRQDAILQLIS